MFLTAVPSIRTVRECFSKYEQMNQLTVRQSKLTQATCRSLTHRANRNKDSDDKDDDNNYDEDNGDKESPLDVSMLR